MLYCATRVRCGRAYELEVYEMNISTDWQVESLRISVFPVEIESVSPSKLWEKHVGEPEPEIHIQPGRINQRNAKHRNGDIYLVKVPNQIDWRYVLPPDATTTENGLSVWGNLKHEVNVFLEFSKDFLQDPGILPVNRLAFGAVLMKPTSDLISSYRYLADLLPRFDLENAADFGYQISRRRISNVFNELQINRLSRWDVVTLERNESTLDPVQDAEENRIGSLSAARLELDINTVPLEAVALPPESLLGVFEEFVQIGLEIARIGDIR